MKIKINLYLLVLLNGVSFLLCGNALAENAFEATPVRVYLNQKVLKENITVVNTSVNNISLQVSVKSWDQDDNGKDILKDSKDIIFFPKILTLRKNQKRVIRLGYNGSKNNTKEKTYRIIISEILEKKVVKETNVRFRLNISIPIFLAPVKEQFSINTENTVISSKNLAVGIKNKGNVHVFVDKILATGVGVDNEILFKRGIKGWYVLSGMSNFFNIPVSKDECKKSREIKLKIETLRNGLFEKSFKTKDKSCK